ncbi:MAG: Cu+ exporting ATPase, partial [Enterobacterales bacterium]|nr:Cu+ exporting ATPase [Enterobacterales bacterium]
MDEQSTQQLIIEGAGCASCVSKIEGALKAQHGVMNAEMNFADRTVIIAGEATTSDLIKAVESVGYNAKPLDDTGGQDVLDEKEAVDKAYYQKLMLHTFIALSLGLPLMIYSLVVGEMSVESELQQLVWFVIGLLTFGVMFYSGKHFYIGAWKSLISHSANMDTLIALGTGTAWFYSMVVVFIPDIVPLMARHVYFEATAMIIGLINLG